MVPLVERDEVRGELPVGALVGLVEDQVDQVEAREQRRPQVDVVDDGALGVVLGVDRVGARKHGGARVERADDARLVRVRVRVRIRVRLRARVRVRVTEGSANPHPSPK